MRLPCNGPKPVTHIELDSLAGRKRFMVYGSLKLARLEINQACLVNLRTVLGFFVRINDDGPSLFHAGMISKDCKEMIAKVLVRNHLK